MNVQHTRFRSIGTLLSLAVALALGGTNCGGSEDNEGTGEESGPAPATDAEKLTGSWSRKQGAIDVTVTFGANGSYSQRTITGGSQDTLTEGTWSVESGRLSVRTALREEVYTFFVDETRYSRSQVYVRESFGEGAAGAWEAVEESWMLGEGDRDLDRRRTDTMQLAADGTLEYSSRTLNANNSPVAGVPLIDKRPGTWSQSGSELTLTFPSTGDIRTFEIRENKAIDLSPLYLHSKLSDSTN